MVVLDTEVQPEARVMKMYTGTLWYIIAGVDPVSVAYDQEIVVDAEMVQVCLSCLCKRRADAGVTELLLQTWSRWLQICLGSQ